MRRAVLAISIIVAGCGQPQPKPPLEQGWRPDEATGDYGAYPENYDAIVKEWYSQNLKDPYSAVYESISRPRKEHAIVNQFAQTAIFGYSVCADVNAKNSYGAYTGAKRHWFLIHNGLVVREQPAEHHIYLGRPTNCADGE